MEKLSVFTYLGDDRFQLDPSPADVRIDNDTFPNWIVTEESEEGTIARLSFDDYVWKDRPYAPNNLPIALVAITKVVESENTTDRVLARGREARPSLPAVAAGSALPRGAKVHRFPHRGKC